MRHRTSILVMVAFGLALVAPMLAQDPAKAGGSPDEMMKAMLKAAAVGPHHGHLRQLAGKWSIQGKYRMAPDTPWQDHKSECTTEAVLGGRFLERNYKGEPMLGVPGPFEGIGFLGYDNEKQKYISFWVDNLGTMMLTAEGTC